MGIPLPFTGEFEVVIMIAVWIEEMHGSDCVPDLNADCERALVGSALVPLERNGALIECMLKCALILIDNADIVREAMLRQPARFIRLP